MRRFLILLAMGRCCLPAQEPATRPTLDFASDRFWLSGQANFIEQFHTPFHSPYSGPNSLQATGENALSGVLTLYTGIQVTHGIELLLDIESAGGRGISDALGVAGFTNLDVVRNPTLGSSPYVARIMYHQTFALGDERTEASRTPLSLASSVPVRRLEVRFGKFSTADFFDINSIGGDSHLQFMNWTADNNGAYDYAADTRGYTYGALFEYYDRSWTLRFGEMLMPKIANGIHLDADLARARAENIELELHPSLIPRRHGTLRPLAYVNHANMGNYREANRAYLAGIDTTPDITAYRKQGRIKYGFGLNFEQDLTELWRLYGRAGWSDGKSESFAYTEVDRSFSAGSDIRGARWHRRQDKAGAAWLVNSLSADHRQYLALGGQGFLLGDGKLNYGREQIVEIYYTLHLWRGILFSADLQRIWNPGYNRDRGPALVPGFRMHFEDAVNFARLRK